MGITTERNSLYEGESPLKVSRYPEDVAIDLKVNNSFESSIPDNELVSSLHTSRNNPVGGKLKDDFVQGSSQFRATHQTIPKLSLQQKLSNQIQNLTSRRSYYEQFDETARTR